MSSSIGDREVLAFIKRSERLFPADISGLNWTDMRRIYDMMSEDFRVPRPAGIAVEDGGLTGPGGLIPIRRYWPRDPGPTRVLYFHGGGFVVGGLESHDDVCAEIADRCQTELIAVDYRLAPEHPHPASYDDTLSAIDQLSDRPLVLAGDSAGGNLVAAAGLARREQLRGIVMIYPGLGGQLLDLPAYTERANAPMLTTDDIALYARLHLGKNGDEKAVDPTRAPLKAEDFSGYPRCYISSAEHDPLRDDGPAFAERLAAAGVAAEAVVEPELPHGHLRARHMAAPAKAAFDRIVSAIERFCAQD